MSILCAAGSQEPTTVCQTFIAFSSSFINIYMSSAVLFTQLVIRTQPWGGLRIDLELFRLYVRHFRYDANTHTCTHTWTSTVTVVHCKVQSSDHQRWLYFCSPQHDDEMLHISCASCPGLQDHLKDAVGNLSLSLIHSPLHSGHECMYDAHTHTLMSYIIAVCSCLTHTWAPCISAVIL